MWKLLSLFRVRRKSQKLGLLILNYEEETSKLIQYLKGFCFSNRNLEDEINSLLSQYKGKIQDQLKGDKDRNTYYQG